MAQHTKQDAKELIDLADLAVRRLRPVCRDRIDYPHDLERVKDLERQLLLAYAALADIWRAFAWAWSTHPKAD